MAETTFAVASFDKIQTYIDSGVLKYPSYVLCKDDEHKNNLIFIDKDLCMQPVKGYEQDTIISVDELPTENAKSNVFYFCNGVGYLFINDIPVPVFKNLSDTNLITSYDQLTDIPIVNKYGEPTSPIIVSELDNGNYSISGSYQIGGDLVTTFSTTRKVTFTVDSDESNKYITRFDANQIVLYTVNESLEVAQNKYATEEWVKEQGYTTESYVNQAIESLYDKIVSELLTSMVTKVSQLENDAGYLTANDINGIGSSEIANLF